MLPQFHCIYNNKFETPAKDVNFHNKWAERMGLAEQQLSTLQDNNLECAHILQHFQYPFNKPEVPPVEIMPTQVKVEEYMLEPEGALPELSDKVPAFEPEPALDLPRATMQSG